VSIKNFAVFISFFFVAHVSAQPKKVQTASAVKTYLNNRAPLRPNPYIELPLGTIRPQGWLREMLLRQKSGSTGNLDKMYPLVMGPRNGWLGGDGDQWERGPYWIDGLLPLAYILDDKELIAKVKPWVEWALQSQQPDGYFGPSKDYPNEPGVQRDNSRDWWPKMVMLKILKQYYSATQDQRVIPFMTNYFRYQLKELPSKPLDHWTFWARYRGPDNLMIVYWLYNITGDAFLLQLAELIHTQTFNYTDAFLKGDMLTRNGSIHCVNLAQGIKGPLVYYQQHPDKQYAEATMKGFYDLRKYNGMAHGLYGGDEALHGNNPTQGSELCSAVEMMFSLETILPISGDVAHADMLEKIAFNALPTQVSDDFNTRQYFQQANQVMATRHTRNFDVNHGGTDVCFGLLTGYPCCTSNMHQGWPKFAQNLWYATSDSGLAALVYAPNAVTAFVAGGTAVSIKEETNYPFEESIRFTISLAKNRSAAFPLQLRVPLWCKTATVMLNGTAIQRATGGQIIDLRREWKTGDVVELQLPMNISQSRWYENSVSVERGPIVYALKMSENWKLVKNEKDPVEYGSTYYEVTSGSPWNYALLDVPADKLERQFIFSKTTAPNSGYPWNLESAPVQIKAKAKRIPSWKLYNDMTGQLPYSITYNLETESRQEEIILVPYGCTTLRISQFPVVR
jgi:hypothetical protein